jgi:ZIP family zinc transporter
MGITIASAFPLGAFVAIFVNYPSRIKADIGAFGSGIFFSAIAFSLVNESTKEGNAMTMAFGFSIGAAVFSFSNHELLQRRFSSSKRQSSNYDVDGNSSASPQTVLVGSILDSVPESLFVIIALHVQGLLDALLGNLAGGLRRNIYPDYGKS